MSIKLFATTNILLFFVTLAINGLGAKGFFNGQGQAEVSKKYPTLITPNNFAFSIWGVIYSLLLISLVYLFFQQSDSTVIGVIERVSALFILSSFLNMAWIISFSYEKMGISTVFILGMMLSLMTIVGNLANNKSSFANSLVATAFTLYASWVLIASFINVAVFLIQKEWGRWGISDSNWTIAIITIALVFTVSYTLIYHNAIFPLAIAWAFYGINSSYKEGKIEAEKGSSIQKLLKSGLAILLIVSFYCLVMNKFSIF